MTSILRRFSTSLKRWSNSTQSCANCTATTLKKPSDDKITQMQKKADGLSHVELCPDARRGPTAFHGTVMDRSGSAPVYRVGASEAPPKLAEKSSVAKAKTISFTPLKDSKL